MRLEPPSPRFENFLHKVEKSGREAPRDGGEEQNGEEQHGEESGGPAGERRRAGCHTTRVGTTIWRMIRVPLQHPGYTSVRPGCTCRTAAGGG